MPIKNGALLEVKDVDAVDIDINILKRHHQIRPLILLLLTGLLDKHIDITNTQFVLPSENVFALRVFSFGAFRDIFRYLEQINTKNAFISITQNVKA